MWRPNNGGIWFMPVNFYLCKHVKRNPSFVAVAAASCWWGMLIVNLLQALKSLLSTLPIQSVWLLKQMEKVAADTIECWGFGGNNTVMQLGILRDTVMRSSCSDRTVSWGGGQSKHRSVLYVLALRKSTWRCKHLRC